MSTSYCDNIIITSVDGGTYRGGEGMIPVTRLVQSPDARSLRVTPPLDTTRGRRFDNGRGGGREGGEQWGGGKKGKGMMEKM